LVIEHNQEQSCQTMKLKRAIAAIVLVSAFAAPVAAGTFEDAVDAHARGNYAKARRLIRPLANDGDASAQFNLGLMYATGQGVQQDNAAAALWSPAQINEAAEARTRNGSQLRSQLLIKGVCSAACPPTCSRTTPRGQLRLETLWHRRPHRQLTKVLLVMVRLSLI
jgi:hypothetical protein